MSLQQPPGRGNGLPLEPGDGHLIQSNHEIRIVMPTNAVHDLQVASEVPIVTFWKAIKFSWRNLWNDQRSPDPVVGENHDHEVLPTPLQTWMALNVYPRVTPARILWFLLGSVCFHCALVTFFETKYYTTTIAGYSTTVVRVTFRWMLEIAHTVALAFLLFTGFYNNASERYRRHFLIKSIGDFLLMLGACFLILKIGTMHVLSPIGPPSSDYAVRAHPSMAANYGLLILTCQLLTVDALSIINLLRPGHHYFIFEVSTTGTMHLTLEFLMHGPPHYLGAFSVLFSFIILVIKNFLWRKIVVNGQVPVTRQQTGLAALVPRDVVNGQAPVTEQQTGLAALVPRDVP
ncbi:hypothetical protein I3843_09G038500 [Carya illinoinensis]|nr:hypothetical protein I3843_09G038500 [Carya illinoinensis]